MEDTWTREREREERETGTERERERERDEGTRQREPFSEPDPDVFWNIVGIVALVASRGCYESSVLFVSAGVPPVICCQLHLRGPCLSRPRRLALGHSRLVAQPEILAYSARS